MKMKFLLAVLLFFFIPSLATGEMYKWVDDNGRTHFTDNYLTIPDGRGSRLKSKLQYEHSFLPRTIYQKLQHIEDKIKVQREGVDASLKSSIKAQKEYIRILKDPDSIKEETLEGKLKVDKTSRDLDYLLRRTTKSMQEKLELEFSKIMTDN